jgi:glycosyltransferase involved in cell wall biosynthesis
MPENVRQAVSRAAKGIVMSKFGKRMAEQAGLDVFYVPHGVDTNIFKPLDRDEARERIKLPKDKFIVGMVAANKGNPSRKAFNEQIAAFAALHLAHPDTMLYLHTYDGAGGGDSVNLVKWINRLGLKIGVDVIFCDQYMNTIGFPDPYMVDLYNSLDVLTNVSKGEGFGIPIIEAQACGTPVIVGDWTSMGELCMSGWKVDKSQAMPMYEDRFDAFQWLATTESIYALMEKAYEHRGDVEMRNAARRGALKYDADKITERYWKPVLKEMGEMLSNKVKIEQVAL